MKVKIVYIIILFPFLFSCDKEEIIIDEGDGITIEFLEGLNDDSQFQLSKNSDGYYEMTLNQNENQTVQRISGRLLRDGNPVWEDLWSGPGSKKVEFSSNLYWWLMDGDTITNITYTYINEFTGELTYVNLPPLVNWKDVIVPTINSKKIIKSHSRGIAVKDRKIKKISPLTDKKGFLKLISEKAFSELADTSEMKNLTCRELLDYQSSSLSSSFSE